MTLTPICFHILTMAWTEIASQSGSFLQKIVHSNPSGTPGLGEQLLGLGDVLRHGGELVILRVDRRHMMMLARRPQAEIGDLQHLA